MKQKELFQYKCRDHTKEWARKTTFMKFFRFTELSAFTWTLPLKILSAKSKPSQKSNVKKEGM